MCPLSYLILALLFCGLNRICFRKALLPVIEETSIVVLSWLEIDLLEMTPFTTVAKICFPNALASAFSHSRTHLLTSQRH